MASSSELACVYAALILSDDGAEVTGESIQKIITAAKVEGVEGYLPGLFAQALTGVDINTQQSFEALNPRAVAVVVDPVQSVKGKVVIDCFRLINPQLMMMGMEPRQTTSNIGHLNKPSIQALIHGLNRHYYSICIDYRKNELEEQNALVTIAKDEAEAEIAAYKQQRESQFHIFSKERMGDSGAHKTNIDKETIRELNTIATQVKANGDTMVKMLLQSVTTVG